MALTLAAEQRMERVSLVAFYEAHEDIWTDSAQAAYNFVENNFPDGALIRRDDVAKALVPVLEVNEVLRDKLNAEKLRQKLWITFFAGLIIDRTWNALTGGAADA